jgi:hypothetical protein
MLTQEQLQIAALALPVELSAYSEHIPEYGEDWENRQYKVCYRTMAVLLAPQSFREKHFGKHMPTLEEVTQICSLSHEFFRDMLKSNRENFDQQYRWTFEVWGGVIKKGMDE